MIEITWHILGYRDEEGNVELEKILVTAGQKGTGKWTVIDVLETGIPVTLIGASVFSRCLSALKDERVASSEIINGPELFFSGDRADFISDLEQAILASKIVSYAQGFMLIKEAAKKNNWNINYGDIALMWRGGGIFILTGQVQEGMFHLPIIMFKIVLLKILIMKFKRLIIQE